jgi:hypothetical protein
MFEVTVLDRDTLIGNDNLIGLVYVDLAPLVKHHGPNQVRPLCIVLCFLYRCL